MTKIKDSTISWVGDIPDSWSVVRNKNCFSCSKEIVGERSGTTQLLSLTKSGIKKISAEETTGKVPESYDTYQIVVPNDMVMCLFDLDVSAVFSGISPYSGMISPAYKELKCNGTILPQYADYWFSFVFDGRKFKHYSKNLRYTLTYDEFARLPIVLPDLEEQTRIVNHLCEKCAQIDTVIEKTRETIEVYKRLKRTVITQAVTKGSILVNYLEVPNGWESRKLKTFITIPVVDGPHESPELFEAGVPYISATAIENGKINFDLRRGYISEEYSLECNKKYKPRRNDILVVKLGASTGQVAIVESDDRFNIWVPLAAVRCNEKVNSRFIYYCFQSEYLIRQMELSWTFGTQQTLGVKTIEQLKFLIPPLEEQLSIVAYLDRKCSDIDALILEKTKLLAEIEDYKKTIIYEYVTGKKEVPVC